MKYRMKLSCNHFLYGIEEKDKDIQEAECEVCQKVGDVVGRWELEQNNVFVPRPNQNIRKPDRGYFRFGEE